MKADTKNPFHHLLILLVFSILLNACSAGVGSQVIMPTLTTVPIKTMEPTSTEKPTLTSTSTATLTPTFTPTPTSTSTVTPTPTPSYPGDALILFTAVDEQGIWHCGVASADGNILIEDAISPFDGFSIITEDGTFIPPRYCAPGSPLIDWSADMQQFIFSVFSTQERIYYLFAGHASSDHYALLTRFPSSDKDKIELFFQMQSMNDRNPWVHWLDNRRIWLESFAGDDSIINILTREQSVLEYPVRGISPDGKYFTYQKGSVYLTQFDKDRTIDLSRIADARGIEISAWPIWAPDSRRFVLYGKKEEARIWVIFDVGGNLLSTVEEPHSFTWSPDGNQLLFDCNVQRAGQSAIKEMCLYTPYGALVKKFPWQPYRISNGNFSEDGRYIYYLLSDAPPAKGSNNFAAKLVRLEIETGEEMIVGEGLNDLSWIRTDQFTEVYETEDQTASAVDESPDGKYLLLNNAGSFFGDRKPRLVHSVICNFGNGCTDLILGGFNVIGAAWWTPPPGWKPIELINQLSLEDDSAGTIR